MELSTGQLVSQQYEILEILGRGGFGIVYRARDTKLEREVALKILLSEAQALSPTFVQRFHREIKLIRQLEHPNVVRLYDFGELDGEGSPYMVMEFVRGQEVAQQLEKCGAMTATQAQHIMLQMLDGLVTAHKLGIVHRDLKPNNLMLTEVGMNKDFVKILDFGIAKAVVDAERETKVTFQTQNQLVGTPSYMAPEQLRQETIGPATDVYAAGLIFIELLTGKALLEGTMVEVVARHIDPRPHELPPPARRSPFAALIERAVAKNAAERFADAAAMYEALRRIQVSEDDDAVGALATGHTGPMAPLRQDSGPVSGSSAAAATPLPASIDTGVVAAGGHSSHPAMLSGPIQSPLEPPRAGKLLPILIGLTALVLVGVSVVAVLLLNGGGGDGDESAGATESVEAAELAGATTPGVPPVPSEVAATPPGPPDPSINDRATPPADGATPPADGATPPADGATARADAGSASAADDGATVAADAGTPSDDAGTPSDDAGTPSDDAGTPSTDPVDTAQLDAGTPDDEPPEDTPPRERDRRRDDDARTDRNRGDKDVRLTVRTDPPRAEVTVGGKDCRSPCELRMKKGRNVKITARRKGYRASSKEVTVDRDMTIDLKLYRGL